MTQINEILRKTKKCLLHTPLRTEVRFFGQPWLAGAKRSSATKHS